MRRRIVALVFGLLAACVNADQTIVIDGADASIKYTTVNNGDAGATWAVVQRSPDSCDTPQMLTSRLGDYMTYTFTGTGIKVLGTIGRKRGEIIFTFDGVNSTFDRSNPVLVCDSILFEKSGLPYQQHTISATLVGRAPNYSSGVIDGVISIQRIRYTIPGGSKGNVGAIAGGVVAGVVALALLGFIIWWFFKKRTRTIGRRTAGGYVDDEDGPTPMGKSERTTPGIVATPFVWNGPGSQYTQPDVPPHGYNASNAPPTPSTTALDHNNAYPSPHTSTQLPPTSYFPPTPLSVGPQSSSGPRTSTLTSSSGDRKRESALSAAQAAAAQFALSNPGSPELASPHPSNVGSGGGHSPADDHLVDRIAHRLADIMQVRTGGVGVMDQIVPPPVYSPDHAARGGGEDPARAEAEMEMTPRSPPMPGPSQLPYMAGPSASPSPPASPPQQQQRMFGPRPYPGPR